MGVRIAAGLHSAILAIAIGSRLTPFLCIGIFLKKEHRFRCFMHVRNLEISCTPCANLSARGAQSWSTVGRQPSI